VNEVDAVREAYEAFTRGDLEAVLGLLHPEIVWEQAQGLPHGGTYNGVDEVRSSVFAPLHRDWWEAFDAEPHEMLGTTEGTVVVLGRYTGVARRTGKRLDVPFVHVWSLDGGRATRFRQFLDTAGWNAALAPPEASPD
jgi:ketosteroid isomerase-like protein